MATQTCQKDRLRQHNVRIYVVTHSSMVYFILRRLVDWDSLGKVCDGQWYEVGVVSLPSDFQNDGQVSRHRACHEPPGRMANRWVNYCDSLAMPASLGYVRSGDWLGGYTFRL